MVTRGYKELQAVTGGYNVLEGVTKLYIGLQGRGCYKGLEKVTGG